jgi:ferredoxin
MAKTRVKKDTCIGCGVCTSIADAVFAFGADGLAENVLGDETELPADLVPGVEEAAASCPTSAIEVKK